MKNDLVGTGGGPAQASPLSDTEERALRILGETFFKGSGVEELGFGPVTPVASVYTEEEAVVITSLNTEEEASVGTSRNLPSSSKEITLREKNHIGRDHPYSKTPQRTAGQRKPNSVDTELEMCRESVSLLREIRDLLRETNKSLSEIKEKL